MNNEIKIPGLSDRVKLAKLAVVTRQLATMVDSGLSVVRALAILADQVENKELARVLDEVQLDVERGSSLSAACAKHPKVFCTLFVHDGSGRRGRRPPGLGAPGPFRDDGEAGRPQPDNPSGHDLPGRGVSVMVLIFWRY